MSERVLITGGGGREHALAWKLDQSPHVEEISIAPGNVGTLEQWENVQIAADDAEGIVGHAEKRQTSLVILGPDASVKAAVADACEQSGIACFGPSKWAGRLEWDNEDAYDFMDRYDIPCPETYYGTNQMTHANAYVRTNDLEKYIIRVKGLADGKGVLVPESEQEAYDFIQAAMVDLKFGEDNNSVMFQERLHGPELSLFVLADGHNYLWLPHCRDHKRLLDDDDGPNTGGMGVYAPVDGLDPDLTRQLERLIIKPTLENLIEEGRPYKGVLYVGVILTPDGPKVIEYNARFGDPECQALMPLIDEDIYPRLKQVPYGALDTTPIKTRDGYVVTVALSAEGYPKGPLREDDEIHGLELTADLAQDEIYVFHSGTRKDEATGKIVTNGGRVLHIASFGETLAMARQKAYSAIGKQAIWFEGYHFRKDIGLT